MPLTHLHCKQDLNSSFGNNNKKKLTLTICMGFVLITLAFYLA